MGGRFMLVFLILMSFACQSQLPESETAVRRGITYQMGAEKPFTGIVVGRAREGYRTQIFRYQKQYKDGLLNGECKFWYPNGKLESLEPYKNGQINGTVVRYYDNGQMKASIPMKNGMRGGSAGEFFWDRTGKLIKR